MSGTEKLILEQLQTLNQNFTGLNQKVDKLDQKVDKLDQKVNELDQKVVKLDQESIRTQLLIENEISKKIDIIGEGHDFLKQNLDDALKMEKKRESMELQLINHKIEIDKIKRHANIA